ncbi:MAG: diphthine--ammonia ligase [Promethearchaeota archaeon]
MSEKREKVMEPVIISWSGGKDSVLALYLLNRQDCNVRTLITTISEEYNRVSMHGVRKELLEEQAKSIGIPLLTISLPKDTSNDEYEKIMKREMLYFKSHRVYHVVFGDIFLEDIRNYRESNLSKIGMKAIFPLWKKNTMELAKLFINLGFKAILTSVDSSLLEGSYIGRLFDQDFLDLLPPEVDPCGENGEFHSFVFDGPIFSYPIQFQKGEKVVRENRFFYIDLTLK